MSGRLRKWSLAAALLGLSLVSAAPAAAQSTIKRPGQRPSYYVELEPHALLGLFEPPGFGDDVGFGAGFRAGIELLGDGFLPKLNDSVALGFGLDYLRYDGVEGWRGGCVQFVSAPSGVPVCVDTGGGGGYYDRVDYFFVPVVMQWNFWLHRKWSVFGEPGVALYWQERDVDFAPLVLYAGGRFHFSDRVTLTLRVGYPTFSLGVSFLL